MDGVARADLVPETGSPGERGGRHSRHWAPWEDSILRDLSLSHAQVAARTRRTHEAVAKRRMRLGLARRRAIPFSDAEIEILCDTSLSDGEAAEITGRTIASVQNKRGGLRRAGVIEPLAKRNRKWPHWVRYEDDPRAVGPGRPVFIPARHPAPLTGSSAAMCELEREKE